MSGVSRVDEVRGYTPQQIVDDSNEKSNTKIKGRRGG